MAETFETVWGHVRKGATVVIRGQLWKVKERDPAMVLVSAAHGERVGTPKPNTPVTVVVPPEVPGTTMEQAVSLVARSLGGEVIARSHEA